MKVDFAKLDRAFNPRCVVVVGAKRDGDYMWLRSQSTFKGHLYSVQVAPDEIPGIKAMGIPNYASLMDIPEPIDLVIVAVPRAVAPRILEDCIKLNVAAVHFFTSGFAETSTEEGIKLQRLMTERAEQADMHIIGPNCMGIFSPKAGIRHNQNQYAGISGPVGFIAQSGTHAGNFSLEAHIQGVDINKSVSFGNGIVLESTDYLEYFGQDPEIKAIGMYLEGVHDGRRFLKVLQRVAARKPVVIWKGGRTEEGGRAIASHTGSLAVPLAIWDAAIRQYGAISVSSQEELIDTLKAILQLSPVYGDGVGIAGGSGGQSVAIADVFAEAGLKVPLLTRESYNELAGFFSLVGASYRNPIDPGANRKEARRIMEILEQDANIDNLVLLTSLRFSNQEQLNNQIELITDIRSKTAKPVMAILLYMSNPQELQQANEAMQRLQSAGVPTFPSLERGAAALRNALDYYRLKSVITPPAPYDASCAG